VALVHVCALKCVRERVSVYALNLDALNLSHLP